jgi:molybdopterin-containing oxidoreductase family iron-sulfur binding subunit
MDRRRFLTVLGATGSGAAAASACGIGPEPTEQLVPYLVPPENQVPGIATYYATTCRECAAGCGLHAKVREGRVIKLEGNPDSPINQGRLCSRGQAALQGLYNPDRITDPIARGAKGEWQKLTWDDAIGRLQAQVQAARGKGIAFVTGLESGSFGELVDAWTKQAGGRHVTYEPFAFEALREGNRIAFGTAAIPWYDFANARYVMSFGADFMETWLSPVGYQNGFTRAHAFQAGRDAPMAKFVYVGPRLALTGMSADEWIAAAPGSEGALEPRDHLSFDPNRRGDPLRCMRRKHVAEARGVSGNGRQAVALDHVCHRERERAFATCLRRMHRSGSPRRLGSKLR